MQIIIDYCKFILNRLQIWPKKVFHFSFVIFIHANSSIFMHAMVKKLCPHCQLQLGDFQLEENEHSNYVRHFSALLHFLCVVQQWVQGTFSFVMSVIFTPMLTLTNSFPSKIWLSTGLMCFDLQQNEARMWNLFRQPLYIYYVILSRLGKKQLQKCILKTTHRPQRTNWSTNCHQQVLDL